MRLEKKYQLINDGDKVKELRLKEPNPSGNGVICFPDFLPKELKLEPFIDYETQFQKEFIDPLMIMIGPMGWETEKKKSLPF